MARYDTKRALFATFVYIYKQNNTRYAFSGFPTKTARLAGAGLREGTGSARECCVYNQADALEHFTTAVEKEQGVMRQIRKERGKVDER